MSFHQGLDQRQARSRALAEGLEPALQAIAGHPDAAPGNTHLKKLRSAVFDRREATRGMICAAKGKSLSLGATLMSCYKYI
ncbi:hypothetical protein AAKU55_004507 [Oxalobacteraceae bacterium GrIS 1.11]